MTARSPIFIAVLLIVVAAVGVFAYGPLNGVFDKRDRSSEEFRAHRSLFTAVLHDPQAIEWRTNAKNLGFSVVRDNATGAVILAEQQGACPRKGVYRISSNPRAIPVALTAPHAGSDRLTGAIAESLFAANRWSASARNSAPRYPTKDCPDGEDIARLADHPFSAFTSAFAAVHPRGRVVQLHGFDGDRRESLTAAEGGMIVSNATKQPDDALLDLADCLSIRFAPAPVLVFPMETGELGGTTNAQGRVLQRQGFGGFVHLEISPDLRMALSEDRDMRDALASCLVDTLPDGGAE